MKNLMFVTLAVVFLSSCSTVPQRRLESAEHALDTDGTTTMLFHSSLYYPTELSLRFDGYIVGVEKSPRKIIASSDDLKIKEIQDAGVEKEYTESLRKNDKLLYISHIIDNESVRSGLENCTIYNAYNQVGGVKVKQIAQSCPDSLNTPIAVSSAYKNSWAALAQLEKSMAKRIQKGSYSHIVVITMGWNTVQEEAIRNFNSIVSSMKSTANSNFNPLVIGVTWPSQWVSNWIPSAIFTPMSFGVKADDADELGLTWLGVLLHQTIPNAKGNLPVIVIGHSFGSRASSVAACVGPVIYENNSQPARTRIDAVINLQGAFPSNRLFGENDRKFHYPQGCKNVDKFVLTASVHDTAMKSHFWGTYAGDLSSFKKYCDDVNEPMIQCVRTDSDGNISQFTKPAVSNITYIDASNLIRENAYLSGGGAHSDIYKKEDGVLLNGIISIPKAESNLARASRPLSAANEIQH